MHRCCFWTQLSAASQRQLCSAPSATHSRSLGSTPLRTQYMTVGRDGPLNATTDTNTTGSSDTSGRNLTSMERPPTHEPEKGDYPSPDSATAAVQSDMEGLEGLEGRERALRRLLWKQDLLLMPLLTVTLGLQYYDKAALGSAAAFGILTDLALQHNGTTARYATATACFYYGYIVAVLPGALLFARLNLRYAAGTVITLWGLVALLTVVVTGYKGLYVQRVFLGLLESAVSPCCVAITALWYKPQEQAKRMGIWYSATGIFSMFNGLINFALGSSGDAHAWKYMCVQLQLQQGQRQGS